MAVEIIELDKSSIQGAYTGWYYTILGQGGDLNDWTDGLQEIFDEEGVGKVAQWYHTTGAVVNRKYGLRGNNAFKNDLSILMFAYDGMDVGKLAILKLKLGHRWFTDIIDNQTRNKEE